MFGPLCRCTRLMGDNTRTSGALLLPQLVTEGGLLTALGLGHTGQVHWTYGVQVAYRDAKPHSHQIVPRLGLMRSLHENLHVNTVV